MHRLRATLFCALTLAHPFVGYAFQDFGDATLPLELFHVPTPRPHQLPDDADLRYELLPSMITAVAPSFTIAPNGTRETLYSVHYHHYFSKTRQGKGIFDKRGVFSGDPPISTCTPCGRGTGQTSGGPSSTTASVSCTTNHYSGVFQFPDPAQTTTSYCYDSYYSGIFESPTSTSTGLPCCFTIPQSCRLNASTTTSFTLSSGVFRSTTSTSSLTSSRNATSFTTALPSSRSFFTTPTSTSRSLILSGLTSSSRPSSQSLSTVVDDGRTSSALTSTMTFTSSVASSLSPTTRAAGSSTTSNGPYYSTTSTRPYSSAATASPSSSTSITSTAYSIIVISSTTITITSSGAGSQAPGSSQTSTTLTIITVTPSTVASSSTGLTTILSNTIIGCGTVSGSGVAEGSGTVYLGGTSVTSSGTVTGSASSNVGCGTFTGSGTITGCGSGSGTATLTGSGTLWPAGAGGLISIVSSGIASGSGSFSGCGTLTGSGTFVATDGYATVIDAPVTTRSSSIRITSTPAATTVQVFVSYCPTSMDGMGLPRLGQNLTNAVPSSSNTNDTSVSADRVPDHSNHLNALCNTCPNAVGICCPPTVDCELESGKCPLLALEGSSNTLNGYLIAQIMNSTAPVAGRKKVRALERPKGAPGDGRHDLHVHTHIHGPPGLDARSKRTGKIHQKQF